ncbi:MAG: 50S ribosomal protein L5 [Kiritimatiellales bacterium]|jgi:large subunit ribosomal protein L5|nr:50S ribosomal protein L5 [Kiritimatiellales bacterium]
MIPAMKKKYRELVVPELQKKFNYGNCMQIPSLSKININVSVGMQHDRDALQAVLDDLGKITGQRPVTIKARKSVSNFKLREGVALAGKVTLRGARMYEFMDRLINIALPRIRDFRGIPPKSFDGRGNYSLGLTEQTIFPEINPDHVRKVHGMDVTFVTTAKSNAEAYELLSLMGMPFEAAKNKGEQQ